MNKILTLTFLVISCAISAAQASELLAKVIPSGKYRVVSRDCFDTGNSYNSPVAIRVVSNQIKIAVRGASPFVISMFEGKVSTSTSDGAVLSKGGIAFGNGFAYGEETRKGRFILNNFEYLMAWEFGKINFSKTTRINARHSTKSWCDLAPAQ